METRRLAVLVAIEAAYPADSSFPGRMSWQWRWCCLVSGQKKTHAGRVRFVYRRNLLCSLVSLSDINFHSDRSSAGR